MLPPNGLSFQNTHGTHTSYIAGLIARVSTCTAATASCTRKQAPASCRGLSISFTPPARTGWRDAGECHSCSGITSPLPLPKGAIRARQHRADLLRPGFYRLTAFGGADPRAALCPVCSEQTNPLHNPNSVDGVKLAKHRSNLLRLRVRNRSPGAWEPCPALYSTTTLHPPPRLSRGLRGGFSRLHRPVTWGRGGTGPAVPMLPAGGASPALMRMQRQWPQPPASPPGRRAWAGHNRSSGPSCAACQSAL